MPPNYRQHEGVPLARSERRAGWAVGAAVVVIGAGLGIWQIAGGGGATLLPAIALDAEAGRARLHARPLAVPFARRTIGLIWRKGSSEQALRAIGTTIRAAYPKSRRGRAPDG